MPAVSPSTQPTGLGADAGFLVQISGALFQSPIAFYNRGQRWDVARDPGDKPQNTSGGTSTGPTGLVTTTSNRPMDAYYTQAALPGENQQSFVITRSFTPASSDNSKLVLWGGYSED